MTSRLEGSYSMIRNEKILVLTGALGDGHNKAAQAISEAVRSYRPDVEVEVVDFLEWTHPYLHSVGKYCFIQWVKNLPSVYGYLYNKTRDENTLSNLFKKMRSFSTDRMLELLEVKRPTEVVSTFPGAAGAMSFLRSHGLTDVPTVTVLTDYTVHSYWIHPLTDKYMVGAELVKKKLLLYGIQENQIVVTGMPLRKAFMQTYDRLALRQKYDVDGTMPIVLVMGGGHGLIGKKFMSILQENEFSLPIHFIFVCGRNDKLRQKLENAFVGAKTIHRIVIEGFVEDIHEWMALADLLITKPGGITVSEALAMELPMMLYQPIPGQEQDNADFLVSIGAALAVKNTEELKQQLQLVINNHSLISDLKKNSRISCSKEGALHVLTAILEKKNSYVPKVEEPHAEYTKVPL